VGADAAPHPLVEATAAAVQAVPTVVAWQLVRPPVEREPSPCDPVRVTPDGGAEVVVRVRLVLGDRVEAERDVLPVRNDDFPDRRSVPEHDELDPVMRREPPVIAGRRHPASLAAANRKPG